MASQSHTQYSYFLIISTIIDETEMRTSQLLLSHEDEDLQVDLESDEDEDEDEDGEGSLKSQLHFFGLRGFPGALVGAGHLSQSTPMSLGVTTSWFSAPFFSVQYRLSLKKYASPTEKI